MVEGQARAKKNRCLEKPNNPKISKFKGALQMKKGMMLVLIGLVMILGASLSFAAGEAGTKDEAVAMVKKAIAYYKANGQEKAFAEFSNPKGKFKDRDLYVVVYNMEGKCLAHGSKKSMIGKELIDFKDVDGKPYMKERIALMKKQKTAWQNYKFLNPVTKKIQPKEMYIERDGNLIFGCGVYKK